MLISQFGLSFLFYKDSNRTLWGTYSAGRIDVEPVKTEAHRCFKGQRVKRPVGAVIAPLRCVTSNMEATRDRRKKFMSLEFSRRSRLPRRLSLGFSTFKEKTTWNYLLRCDEGMTKTSVIINTFCGAVCSCGVFLLPWCVTSLAGKLLQVAEFVFCPQSWATIKVHQIPLRPTSCVGIFFFNWGISWLLLGWTFFKCGIRVRGNKLWMIRNVPNYDVVQIQNGPKK